MRIHFIFHPIHKRQFIKCHQCLIPRTSGGRSQGFHVPATSDVAKLCSMDGGQITGDEKIKRDVDG